jgi:hypothetical protein
MMYYDHMTNYQCGHFQLICDVDKNYIIITQDCGTNLDTSIKTLCISHDWSFLTCSHSQYILKQVNQCVRMFLATIAQVNGQCSTTIDMLVT